MSATMNTLNRLERDHARLVAKLDSIELSDAEEIDIVVAEIHADLDVIEEEIEAHMEDLAWERAYCPWG